MPQLYALPDPSPSRSNASAANFVCTCTNDGFDAAWVHVAGELDMATAPQLERTLREAQLRARLVALDLRDLEFMDSSGVHVIVTASLRARQLARRLIVLRAPAQVDRMFTLTGNTDVVEIADLDLGEPPVQVLLQLADGDRAS